MVFVLFVAWLVACFVVIVFPTVNHPRHADAVVVLGPPTVNGRLEAGLALIRQHLASDLVVSVGGDDHMLSSPLCAQPQHGFTVTCFEPHPGTTRGEAEHVRDLARQHGWASVVVVTSTYHVSRARLIFHRCLNGSLAVVAARRDITLRSWAYQFLYQTGAYVKAFLHRSC